MVTAVSGAIVSNVVTFDVAAIAPSAQAAYTVPAGSFAVVMIYKLTFEKISGIGTSSGSCNVSSVANLILDPFLAAGNYELGYYAGNTGNMVVDKRIQGAVFMDENDIINLVPPQSGSAFCSGVAIEYIRP